MWGKILGGMAGFAMGGPIGALMGAAFGHAAESNFAGQGGMFGTMPNGFAFNFGFNPAASFLPGQREQVYSIGVVMLAAKVAKADGPVNRAEIDAFKRSFRIPPEAARDIGQLFDRARDSAESPMLYANQMGEAFADEPGRLEDTLAALFAIARADGPVNQAERQLLDAISRAFRLNTDGFERASGQRPRQPPPAPGEDPYVILGVARTTPDDELRAAWKRLMRENHPDMHASRGASPEAVKRASDKVARINAAWDRIKRERGL